MTEGSKKRPPYVSAGDIEALFDRIRTLQAPKKVDAGWAATYNLAPNQPVAIPNLLKWLRIIDEHGAANAESWGFDPPPGNEARSARGDDPHRVVTSEL